MSTPGSGLARGLAITFRAMTRRAHTRQYPDVAPELPPRSRGVIALFEENCTVCMLCARECPDWCIYIDSHKETVHAEGAARARQRNVLDRFAIDFSLCMYCGICIEVCPFDALFWSPEFEYAEYDIRDMTHERDRLREWMWTVPPPAALDPLAEPAKEVATVEKARAKAENPDEGETPARGEKSAAAEKPERPARSPRAAKAAEAAGEKPDAGEKQPEGKPERDDAPPEDDHSHPGSPSSIRERRAGSATTPSDGASA
ncbi:MAG TPA: 4Fe-4S binding protein [Mycobacteriales bacterium]